MSYFPDRRPTTQAALFDETLSVVDDAISCDGVSIFVLLPGDTVLELVAIQTIERDLLQGLELPLGKGIAGQVAEQGEGLISGNVPAVMSFHGSSDEALRFKTRSILCCPMRAGGEVVGVLELINKAGGEPFNDAELLSVQALADGVASNWRSDPDDRERFHELCSLVRKVTRAEGISVFTHNAARDKLVLRFSITARKMQGLQEGARINVGQGVAGWTARHVEAALVPDVYQDPRFFEMADALNMYSTRSIVAVPIVHGGRLLGVLEIVNGRGSRSFSEPDLDVLRAVGVELADLWITD